VRLIVSDASPLIVIARTGLIPVLNGMVEELIIPETVYAECTLNLALSGAQAVRAAVEAAHIQVRPDVPRPDKDPLGEEQSRLDAGELAAIRLALALQCPVLMDERLGRQAARRKGLTVIGSAGLLLGAKQRGLIPAVAPILKQWRQSGYFLSPTVITSVLERAGES
jgi:predicted nucleic acid-binding protein